MVWGQIRRYEANNPYRYDAASVSSEEMVDGWSENKQNDRAIGRLRQRRINNNVLYSGSLSLGLYASF